MNHKYYMDEMLKVVKTMKEKTDTPEKVRALPAFKVALILRDKLVEMGLTKDYADAVVTSMDIKVNEAIFADPGAANELLSGYAEMLVAIFRTYNKEFGMAGAVNFCKGMSIEFTT